MARDDSFITPTPQQLRALTHPVRLRMLGILRTDGPQTATALAQRLGLNTGATSYHLRSLAQHGFITDDAERGNGRERWWQAAHSSTRTGWEEDASVEHQEIDDAYLQTVVTVYAQQMQAAVEARSGMSEERRNAMTFTDYRFRLTPAKARRLVELLGDHIEELTDDADEPDEAGSEPYVVMFHLFPRPEVQP